MSNPEVYYTIEYQVSAKEAISGKPYWVPYLGATMIPDFSTAQKMYTEIIKVDDWAIRIVKTTKEVIAQRGAQ